MKIGLVTFFKSYNYGVWLQAYATQKYLDLQGYDIEIIDYVNKYENDKLKISYKEGDKKLGYLTSALKALLFGRVKYYNRGFKKYLHDCYKLSSAKYTDIKQLEKVDYDALIVGSDQVWNPRITNGLDKVFLLQFGNPKTKLSIASSLGSKELLQKDKEDLINALQCFDAISVREVFAKEYLEKEISKDIKVLSDPTFLLTKEQWIENMAKKSRYYKGDDGFILTYFVTKEKKKENNIRIVKEYSSKLGLPVWSIQFNTYFSEGIDRKIVGASIFDFIALMNRAKLIITDSFHGAALSINLNKNFIAVENTENPIRTNNLLNKVGLIDRVNMIPSDYNEVDYKTVNETVNEMREESQLWIRKALK